MHQIECTPPPDKAVTPAVVAPVAAGRGECTHQVNRHHLRRSHWYIRSKRLILSSLAASTATIASTSHATAPIVFNSANAGATASCMVVPPEFWLDFASKFAWGLLGLVVPATLIVLTIFYGLILPRLKAYFDRRYQVDADFQETRQ